jgi:phenylacetate-CoA ligase
MPTPYEELRQRHVVDFTAQIPTHLQRLSWSAEQLRTERQRRLRLLVRTAQDRSPWHRERLAGIDVDAIDDQDLRSLPVMTKDDLMAHWDDIVTDRRLTLADVEKHLAGLTTDAYLLDHYHAVASSGSSGMRGVFVFDWEAWITVTLLSGRYALKWGATHPDSRPRVAAIVAAEGSTHITSAMAQTFTNPAIRAHRLPVTLPLAEIVAGLNELQPTNLTGYPSMLNVLATEATAGRLQIQPARVFAAAEPLLPETRSALEAAWEVPVVNGYGTSEGLIASGCGYSQGLHLSDDVTCMEPVDGQGRPVAPGQRSAKIYFTNLYNFALPLIRYEITDQVVVLEGECPCGSAHRRIGDVEGRLDDIFTYPDGVQVHPHVFRSLLSHQASVLEYQVRQTERGATLNTQLVGELAADDLRREIEAALGKVGLQNPAVAIVPVSSFERGATGKLKRFVPLALHTEPRGV